MGCLVLQTSTETAASLIPDACRDLECIFIALAGSTEGDRETSRLHEQEALSESATRDQQLEENTAQQRRPDT